MAFLGDVFISYARADEAVARRVAKALQSAGLAVWWDANLPAHRAYSEEIERNLDEAKAVVVLWSKTAAGSQWVRAEADFARNAGKLVQAQVDGTLPPMPFNQIQCADLRGWRRGASHAGWVKLRGSVGALVSGEKRVVPARKEGVWDRLEPYRWPVAALFALLLAGTIYFYAFGGSGEQRRPVLAVLPFKSLDSHDESLVAGMWEDTRTAIGRNPQLIVLGPNTAQQLAAKGEGAAKKAADYLLEASVRSAGNRIRVSADLVRTRDGVQVWSQDFDRKLDDVFALQSEIAGEIEGRIRGRLAEKGGVTPEHIATSGEVYALYSDARAKIRKRDLYGGYEPAIAELKQVVRMDPNFAPGWASLAVAEQLAPFTASGLPLIKIAEASEGHARHAIVLAPNLAAGHAALALTLGLTGPIAEAEIRRAVELDPNDPEALLWLGNVYMNQNHTEQALKTWSRAVDVEPLWWPAILAKVTVQLETGDRQGALRELNRVHELGSRQLEAAIAIEMARSSGNLARAARIGLAYLRSAPPDERGVVTLGLWDILLQLDYDDAAWKIAPAPPFARLLRKDDPRSLAMVEALHLPPAQFFSTSPLQTNVARAMLANGRGRDLVAKYKALNSTPEQLEKLMGRDDFILMAPFLATALGQSGARNNANSVLSTAEAAAGFAMPNPRPFEAGALARIYALEGRNDEAISMLAAAVRRGWLPPAPQLQNDIAADPAFAALKGDPRFKRLREQILGTINRERAALGTVEIALPSSQPSTA